MEFGHAVSVIVVVGLENLSCCCDHCVKVVNVANKPDKNNVRQGLLPQNLILFRSHVTSVFQGLSLSLARAVGRVGENPGNEVGIVTHAFTILLANRKSSDEGTKYRKNLPN